MHDQGFGVTYEGLKRIFLLLLLPGLVVLELPMRV